MRISELQDKNVINMSNGKNIGRITDLEINEEGKIINFYVIQRKLFKFFSSNQESLFTIKDINKIGEDVILVNIE
ncbi:MAG: YlmC/YmxH family sporulation protein [Bacilli bacterium]|nr:YlmC/YmxH family sporulation protein [Bacilli bacterium]